MKTELYPHQLIDEIKNVEAGKGYSALYYNVSSEQMQFIRNYFVSDEYSKGHIPIDINSKEVNFINHCIEASSNAAFKQSSKNSRLSKYLNSDTFKELLAANYILSQLFGHICEYDMLNLNNGTPTILTKDNLVKFRQKLDCYYRFRKQGPTIFLDESSIQDMVLNTFNIAFDLGAFGHIFQVPISPEITNCQNVGKNEYIQKIINLILARHQAGFLPRAYTEAENLLHYKGLENHAHQLWYIDCSPLVKKKKEKYHEQ